MTPICSRVCVCSPGPCLAPEHQLELGVLRFGTLKGRPDEKLLSLRSAAPCRSLALTDDCTVLIPSVRLRDC